MNAHGDVETQVRLLGKRMDGPEGKRAESFPNVLRERQIDDLGVGGLDRLIIPCLCRADTRNVKPHFSSFNPGDVLNADIGCYPFLKALPCSVEKYMDVSHGPCV